MKAFPYPFAMPLFPEIKFLFFLLFPTYFLFLLVKSRSRESFFSKEHMAFESSVIFKFNFFLVLLLLVKDL